MNIRGKMTLSNVDKNIDGIGFAGFVIHYEDYEIPYVMNFVCGKFNDSILSVEFEDFDASIFEDVYNECSADNIDYDALTPDLFNNQFTDELSGENFIELVFDNEVGCGNCESLTLLINEEPVVINSSNVIIAYREHLL